MEKLRHEWADRNAEMDLTSNKDTKALTQISVAQ